MVCSKLGNSVVMVMGAPVGYLIRGSTGMALGSPIGYPLGGSIGILMGLAFVIKFSYGKYMWLEFH